MKYQWKLVLESKVNNMNDNHNELENDYEIRSRRKGKKFDRIIDILDILEEMKGPFTTNTIVKEMQAVDRKIRYETIKKYLELIYEISNRGILESSMERSKDSANLILWNYKPNKEEDARKLYNHISEFNSTNEGIDIEILRNELQWSPRRMKNTLRVLIKDKMIQFESNKVLLERSWLNFEEWITKNSINPRQHKISSENKENFIEEELSSPKLKGKERGT